MEMEDIILGSPAQPKTCTLNSSAKKRESEDSCNWKNGYVKSKETENDEAIGSRDS